MRKSFLIFLCFTTWQGWLFSCLESESHTVNAIHSFLFLKEVQRYFLMMVKAWIRTTCLRAHSRGRSLLSQIPHPQLNRALLSTLLLPFTLVRIRRSLIMLHHLKPGRYFVPIYLKQCETETDSIHFLDLRGLTPVWGKNLMRFPMGFA